jgi:hypothetical protein
VDADLDELRLEDGVEHVEVAKADSSAAREERESCATGFRVLDGHWNS